MPVQRTLSLCLPLFLLLFGWAGVAAAIAPSELLPPEQAFRLEAKAQDSGLVLLSWDVAPGYYLYRSKFKFTSKTPGVTLGEAQFPAGKIKHDEHFGEMEIYQGRFQVTLPLARDKPSIVAAELEVAVQGCNEPAGVCFPPYKQKLLLSLPPPAPAVAAPPSPADAAPPVVADNPLGKLAQMFGGAQDKLLPPEQAFRFSAQVKDAATVRVDWQIAPGYYLYRDRFKFALLDNPGVALGEVQMPAGVTKQEEEGPRQVFYDDIGFDLPLKRSDDGAATIRLQAKFQGCAEKGVCYPPMEQIASLDLPAAPAQPDAAPAASKPPPPATAKPKTAEHDRIADSLRHDSVWLVAASFFGFGLLMAFSPCIFPMIPILSGIIVGHGHKLSQARAFLLSLSYVLAAALAYAVFGVLAGLFGGNLQATLQNPWVLGAFSGVFVLLSLSMFGFYELQMPSFIQSRVSELSHKQKGGTLTGAAVMGALSALIVGPCMAAPLAGALIYIGETGDAVLGGLALFAMGLGMGVPLLAIGLSAGTLLPRAGVWMNAVKSSFGVGMLAVAVWLLSRVLPPPVTLSLWALLLIVPAIYLSALDSLPHDASGWRKLWKGVGVAMLAEGVLMLIGVSQGGGDPLQPLKGLALAAGGRASAQAATPFRRVADTAELDAALQAAQAQGRWVMLDYYADWCVSCKEMERETFADPQVRRVFDKMLLLQADVTANSDEDAALLSRFGLYGPPATLFFGRDGVERKDYRVVGFMGPEAFLAHLREVMR
ncbi:MAG: protein-disulfide reductase DsbD [Candidatus Methylumidiphilus sp.]